MKKVSEFRYSNKNRNGRKQKKGLLVHAERKANKHNDRFYGYYSDDEER